VPVLVLFVFSVALRLLFAHATPDGGPGWHVGFQGDAPVWQQFASGNAGTELLLPLRPPGMHWFVDALWDGSADTVWLPRLVFTLLGATVAPLVWLVLRAHVAAAVAFAAAAMCAMASNLLLVSSGLHVEALYLVLVLLSLLLQARLAVGPRRMIWALAWGALEGATCLLRAEHVLTTVVFAVLARRAGASWRALGLATLAAAAVLVPWQLHANAQVDAFQSGAAPPLPLATLPWDEDAIAALRRLPTPQQLPTHGFVTATMHARGAPRVRAADLAVVDEAYGAMPQPLPHRFVAMYGALNFFLGNTPEADGGFSSLALDRPPPLAGGDHRYPRGLRNALPKNGSLAPHYPPHIDAIVNGTARGFAEIAAAPGAAAVRVAKKLWHAVEGAASGVGGFALPIGLSGTRRQVDLVTANGVWPACWRVLVLGVAAFGLWRVRRVAGLWPLFAFAATKLVVVAAVFGYARHGALCVPVLALGLAAAMARAPAAAADTALRLRAWLVVFLVLLGLEAVRCGTVGVTVDGTAAVASLPPLDFRARAIRFD
jgi:hypothetical protein